jgi:predicted esterase
LNDAAHWLAETVNEEVCKLAKTSGKIDFSKIIVGGESQGCLASTAMLLKSHEFFPDPLGGVFGLIGLVPTLFQNPSVYHTGPMSGIP